MNLLHTLVRFSRSHRKGSPTVEFVMVIPFFILMALVVWQMAVAGMAVMDTQAALRDSVRVAAMTQNEDETSQQAYNSLKVFSWCWPCSSGQPASFLLHRSSRSRHPGGPGSTGGAGPARGSG